MTKSVLNGKRILAVDDEPDVLDILEEIIIAACPECTLERATTYEEGASLITARDYDLVILDIMGVRGFDLLEMSVKRNFKVAMLTAHAMNPEALKRSHDLGARAYLPKEKLAEIVPFLEDVVTQEYQSGWRRLLRKLEDYFDDKFNPDWKEKYNIHY
jgi:DNA-binding response OmpR family regulator